MEGGSDVAAAIGLLAAFAWIYLLGFHGGFWRADQRLPDRVPPLENWPSVACVIPARNEAETIAATVNSLLAQEYEGALTVIVVDDNSTDGTAEAVPRDDRCSVISGEPLVAGWTGKVWAMHQGFQQVDAATDYVLFTDADIVHDPSSVARLVSKAQPNNLTMTSLMVRLDAGGFWGQLLIPAFVFFFQKLYPFPTVNNPRRKMAAAAGGCMLVNREALVKAGGLEKISDALIDDCALGALMKTQGPIWLGLTSEVRSLRPYDGLGEIWTMVARTAFHQLRYSVFILIGCVMGLALLYVAGPGVAIYGVVMMDGVALGLGIAAWALMAVAYAPTVRLYGLSTGWVATLPLCGLLYGLMTVDSARRHWMGVGGTWKGRTHSPKA